MMPSPGSGTTSATPGWTGGAEGDLMALNGWSSPQMLRRYGASNFSRGALPRVSLTCMLM